MSAWPSTAVVVGSGTPVVTAATAGPCRCAFGQACGPEIPAALMTATASSAPSPVTVARAAPVRACAVPRAGNGTPQVPAPAPAVPTRRASARSAASASGFALQSRRDRRLQLGSPRPCSRRLGSGDREHKRLVSRLLHVRGHGDEVAALVGRQVRADAAVEALQGPIYHQPSDME